MSSIPFASERLGTIRRLAGTSFHTLSSRIVAINIQSLDETVLQIVLWQLGFTVLDYAFTHELSGIKAREGKTGTISPFDKLKSLYVSCWLNGKLHWIFLVSSWFVRLTSEANQRLMINNYWFVIHKTFISNDNFKNTIIISSYFFFTWGMSLAISTVIANTTLSSLQLGASKLSTFCHLQ